MSPHYSEADLLETYYTQPGQSMPVMMHLADCQECATRYERLEKKVRALGACEHDKPETFWSRQRISIMRKIDGRRERFSFARVAAAAVITVVLGGAVSWRVFHRASGQVDETVVASTTLEESTTQRLDDSSDPWQSDELSDFQSMVAWESWVEDGDQSL